MYKCDGCGMVFEEPVKLKYPLCRLDGQTYYDYDHVCPFCGCEGIEFVEECEECGEYCYEHELTDIDDKAVCLECAKKERSPYKGINSAFDAVFKMLEA